MHTTPEPEGIHSQFFYRIVCWAGIVLAVLALLCGIGSWDYLEPRWLGYTGMASLVVGIVFMVGILRMQAQLRIEPTTPRATFGDRIPVMRGWGDTIIVWYDRRPTLVIVCLGVPIKLGTFMVYVAADPLVF